MTSFEEFIADRRKNDLNKFMKFEDKLYTDYGSKYIMKHIKG